MAALNGEIQAKLWPRDDSERVFAREEGLDLDQVLTTRDLVNSDNTFFAATGVTSGELLEGVRFESHYVHTHTLVLRSKTQTVRFIDAIHRIEQLRDLSNFEL
jgi:fructose-1,6-bisphosphatase II